MPKNPAVSTTEGPMNPSELARLQEENASLRSQNDQVLDALIDLQESVKQLKAGQASAPAAVADNTEEARLDAELDALKEEFADYPAINIFERRAMVGVNANTAIRLKGDPDVVVDPQGERCYWHLRWFNFAIEGRAQRAGDEGYLKVAWDDLADQDSVTTGDRTKSYVCKGERGTEVLCKIPRKLYDYKKRRDAARQQGLLTSESRMRDHVANGVAAMAGRSGDNADQAGTFAQRGIEMTIKPGEKETVTL